MLLVKSAFGAVLGTLGPGVSVGSAPGSPQVPATHGPSGPRLAGAADARMHPLESVSPDPGRAEAHLFPHTGPECKAESEKGLNSISFPSAFDLFISYFASSDNFLLPGPEQTALTVALGHSRSFSQPLKRLVWLPFTMARRSSVRARSWRGWGHLTVPRGSPMPGDLSVARESVCEVLGSPKWREHN